LLDDAEFRDKTFSIATLGICGGAVMVLAMIDPELLTKALLGVAGFLVAVGTCGGSILGLDDAWDDQDASDVVIDLELSNAEAQFRLLQYQYP
jgi:hypothetical protein